jgi:hypothetical protein
MRLVLDTNVVVSGLLCEQDSSRRRHRVVPAPPPSNPRLYSTVLSVECAGDEEVEWQWTETAEGRFVSGYRLVPRLSNPRT